MIATGLRPWGTPGSKPRIAVVLAAVLLATALFVAVADSHPDLLALAAGGPPPAPRALWGGRPARAPHHPPPPPARPLRPLHSLRPRHGGRPLRDPPSRLPDRFRCPHTRLRPRPRRPALVRGGARRLGGPPRRCRRIPAGIRPLLVE